VLGAINEARPQLPKQVDQGNTADDVHLVQQEHQRGGVERGAPARQHRAQPLSHRPLDCTGWVLFGWELDAR
jgi:hypothetical protein